jgi:hypothetical protein
MFMVFSEHLDWKAVFQYFGVPGCVVTSWWS